MLVVMAWGGSMKGQLTFAALGAGGGFERFAKTTRRARFLAEMDAIVPWAKLAALIEPYYPKAGTGRPPMPLERMLRIHFLQHWFNLSDPAMEEALYDSAAMRAFAGIDLGAEKAPDETTILNFPPSARSARAGRAHLQGNARLSRRERLEDRHRHDRRRHHHRCAVFDQERAPGARSRDASDQEG